MPVKELTQRQFRDFAGGMNATPSRTAIKDNQLNFCENAQPIAPGKLRTLAPPAANITTVGAGIATLWDGTLNIAGVSTPFLVTVNNDGSMTQIAPGTGTKTTIAAAGTVTTSARVTTWEDSPLLIEDPTKGYFGWDGTTLTTIDATKTGRDIAVFETSAWLLTAQRTITFTAPNDRTDFNAGHGSGTVVIRDSVFKGSIIRLLSALELLWIVGPSAVNAISNVQASGVSPNVIRTFSNTNIVANVGSIFPSSVVPFLRTFLFLTPYGVYAIVGSTPQKLSDDLDGLFPSLVLGSDQPAAVFTLNNIFVWAVLVTYNDPATGNRPILLCFSQSRWFIASQGSGVTWITSIVQSGTPQLWATDGSGVFQCFAGTGTHTGKIKTKLWDFGLFHQPKHLTHWGWEFSTGSVIPSVTATLENGVAQAAATASVSAQSTLSFTGAGGAALSFTGTGAITWVTGGLLQMRGGPTDVIEGFYLGQTLAWTTAPIDITALALEYDLGGVWLGS